LKKFYKTINTGIRLNRIDTKVQLPSLQMQAISAALIARTIALIIRVFTGGSYDYLAGI